MDTSSSEWGPRTPAARFGWPSVIASSRGTSLKGGWNDYLSEPIAFEGSTLTVRFVANGEPVKLSATDPRLVTYLIQNLEIVSADLPGGTRR